MRRPCTLLLLLAAVLAGLLAYYFSRLPTSDEAHRGQRRLLADLDPDAVSEFQIVRADARITCQREGVEWWIAEPQHLLADRARVEELLELAGTLRLHSYVAAGDVRPEELGLKEPRLVLRLASEGGKKWEVRVGENAPVGELVYVSATGRSGVGTVSRSLAELLQVAVADLRSRRLLPLVMAGSVEEMSLEARKQSGILASSYACRRMDGRWEVVRPEHDLADHDVVEGIVKALIDYRIAPRDFVPHDSAAAKTMAENPDARLTLRTDDTEYSLLLALSAESGRGTAYAMRPQEGAPVKVGEDLLRAVCRDPRSLREPTLVEVRSGDVRSILVEGQFGRVTALRRGERWVLDGRSPVLADEGLLHSLPRQLDELPVRFEPPGADGATAPGMGNDAALSVTLLSEKGGILARGVFGASAGEGWVYATRPPYAGLLLVPAPSWLPRLRQGRLGLLRRIVLEEPANNAVSVQVNRPERFRSVLLDGLWRLSEPVEGRADLWAIQDILGAFSNLRVGSFASQDLHDPAAFGLDDPFADVQVTYGDGSTVHTLQVGARAHDSVTGRYAVLDGAGPVFVIHDAMASYFRKGLASPLICQVADPRRLAVRRDEQFVEYVRGSQADAWHDAAGTALPPERLSRVQAAAELLRNFRSIAIADYVERGGQAYGFHKPYMIIQIDTPTSVGKQIVIGSPAAGGRYAKGPATAYVHIAAKAALEALEALLPD